MNVRSLLDFVEKNSQEVVDLTRALVQIPSENWETYGKEGECQRYVASWMRDCYDRVDVFTPTEVPGCEEHPAYWPGRDYTDRPNVVGSLQGQGGGRSLLFHGHIDVVPTEKHTWTHDPYSAVLENGRIYGRGSYDQKGGLAAAMVAVKLVRRAGIKLAGDIILEAVVDEEYAGANGTVACIVRGYRADAGISTEPTACAIHRTNRCGRVYRIVVRGGTAGLSPGEEIPYNPAYALGRIILALQDFERDRNAVRGDHPLWRELKMPVPVMLSKVKSGQTEPGGALGIPKDGWVESWIYGMPWVTEEELDNELRSYIDKHIAADPFLRAHTPEIVPRTRFLEPSSVSEKHPFVQLLASSVETATGKTAKIIEGGTTSDTGILNKWGRIPTVTLGPGGGRAHAQDEYVEVEDLITLVKIYAVQIVNWCGQV